VSYYPRDMLLWDQNQRRALDNARQKAVREHLEKMRHPVAAAAPEIAAARLAQAKQIVAQRGLFLSPQVIDLDTA